MLDVRRMRVLREVGARGSFSAAAEALSFTQSAVSQQIQALEKEAGVVLVERGARGVRLTEAGAVLVRHADAILSRLDDAEAELEALAGLRGGRLRLATFPSAGASIMPKAIATFRAAHPGIDLSLEVLEPEDAAAKVRTGDADVALLIDTPWESRAYAGLDVVHLLDDHMLVCMPVGHPLASKAKLRLEDLADEAWMLGHMSVGQTGNACPDTSVFLRACSAAGFEPRIAFHSDDYMAIQGFIAAGMGVALIPELAMVGIRDDVVVRPLVRAPMRKIVAATLAGGYRSAAAQAMIDVLTETASAFAADERPALALAG
jgi:DNA-binding transcriptional LysR family regulator